MQQQKYVVISNGNIKRILNSRELDDMNLNELIFSDDVDIKFYDRLPSGIYQLQGIQIEVDEVGGISIIGKVNEYEERKPKTN